MTAINHTTDHRLEVSGMTCGNCVGHVEEALLAVDGVRRADVDLESGHATVEGESMDAVQLVEAVTESGYEARLLGVSRHE